MAVVVGSLVVRVGVILIGFLSECCFIFFYLSTRRFFFVLGFREVKRKFDKRKGVRIVVFCLSKFCVIFSICFGNSFLFYFISWYERCVGKER